MAPGNCLNWGAGGGGGWRHNRKGREVQRMVQFIKLMSKVLYPFFEVVFRMHKRYKSATKTQQQIEVRTQRR